MNTPESVIIDHYPNGQLRTRTEIAGGKRHGLFLEYFETGQLRRECGFFRGWHHGIGKQWLPDGRLAGQFEMTYGTGRLLEWYDNGKPMFDWEMEAGEPHGASRFYFIHGQFRTQYFWHDKKVTRKRFEQLKSEESASPSS